MEQNVTTNTGNDEKVVERLKISMDAHTDFNAVADVVITNTDDLGRIINTIFGGVFKDYYGCKLEVIYMQNNFSYMVVPRLYFKILDKSQYSDNAITAFIPMSEISSSSVLTRVQRVAMTSATVGVKVDITDNGKSILEDFIIKNKINDQIIKLEDGPEKWNQVYRSVVTNNGTFIEVFKLDIFELLRMIYGAKSEDGGKYFYQITPNGSIGAVNQYQKPTNWNLIIMRLNNNNLNHAAKQLGMAYIPDYDGMPNINTERLG